MTPCATDMLRGSTYLIYYGWLCDGPDGAPNAAARSIASLRVPLVVAHFRAAAPAGHINLTPRVLSMLRDAGTDVFAYFATGWGHADVDAAQRAIDDCLGAGVDGIFFDECDSLCAEGQFAYYAALAASVRAHGGKIIANAGVAQCGEKIMEVCDRVMVEHAWRDARSRSLWLRRYPADRVMGVSSNEDNAMGYTVDAQRAIADTREAWGRGVGWHTSTDRYVELPEWLGGYVSALRLPSEAG